MREQFVNSIMVNVCDFLSVEDAKKVKSAIEHELYNYELQPATKELVPINGIPDKVLLFLAAKKLDGLSMITLERYKQHLMRFAGYMQKDLTQVNAMDIRMYIATYSKGGQKNSTISTVLSYLRSFFNWLENEDYIEKSPMRKIKPVKIEKKVRNALTQEELEMIRDSCETLREKALVEFFYSTGCRLDEVYKLNRDDIQWHSETVMVVGKGSKERTVFLNAKAKIHLWKYLNTREDTSEALFVSERKPYGRLCHRSIQRTFNELGKRAGIRKNVYPHLLRHTTATSMLGNGATLSEVQHLLGHEDPATTQIYIDFDMTSIKQSHKKHLA